MAADRLPNDALRRHMREARWNGPALASALRRLAEENGQRVRYDRSTVAHWLAGTNPKPPAPQLLREAFTRRLGWQVSLSDLGLGPCAEDEMPDVESSSNEWLPSQQRLRLLLHELSGEGGAAEANRRIPYELAPLPVEAPDDGPADLPAGAQGGFTTATAGPTGRPHAWRAGGYRRHQRVGRRQIEAVRQVTRYGADHYDAHGGAAARSLLVTYLRDHALPWLRRSASDREHQALLTATAQLVRVLGRTYLDDRAHGLAQRHYRLAYEMATEAEDPVARALVLRDQSSQAGSLGHHRYAAELASAAASALPAGSGPGVRAFVLAQQAVAAARLRRPEQAWQALRLAERFTAASAAGAEPEARYSEAALLYQTAQVHLALDVRATTLSYLRASLRVRPAEEHRTIASTLLQLGHLELDAGDVPAARSAYLRYVEHQPFTGPTSMDRRAEGLYRRLVPLSPGGASEGLLRQSGDAVAPEA